MASKVKRERRRRGREVKGKEREKGSEEWRERERGFPKHRNAYE